LARRRGLTEVMEERTTITIAVSDIRKRLQISAQPAGEYCAETRRSGWIAHGKNFAQRDLMRARKMITLISSTLGLRDKRDTETKYEGERNKNPIRPQPERRA
jgi:hypothetical protein